MVSSLRVDLGVITIKRHSTLPRYPKLKPHNQMQFNVTPKNTHLFGRVSYPSTGDIVNIFYAPPTG